MKVLWRRLDQPGHEFVDLSRQGSDWLLSGVALFKHETMPSRLEYRIVCDPAWRTRSATVSGSVGELRVAVTIRADSGSWTLNEQVTAAVAGCIDVDLNFSPSTNLLPIRRLNLQVGDRASLRAAWLRFPSFALEPLEQTYARVSDRIFRYESAGGKFVAEIETNEAGLPMRYGDLWRAEADAFHNRE
ncbi:MAG TPA: putative glycolipid-binding domain-containing protein [Thermoanaerobaculia bacterium]|nr:putative glycolipid-binding domain-containing protein [Thermoanaerobaculia bacterium]